MRYKYKLIQKEAQVKVISFNDMGHYTGQHCTDASQFFFKF